MSFKIFGLRSIMGSHTSVWIVPGQIQLTRMLSAPCEIARDFVSEIISCVRNKDKKVGLVDADIYGPSQHKMLGISHLKPSKNKDGKINFNLGILGYIYI